MSKHISRRNALGAGLAADASLIGGLHLRGNDKKKPSFPWKYYALDPKSTSGRAYNNYFKGGCMYGVFEAITAQVAEKLGKPYTDFPFQMSTYGGGGVAGWGTLCGTCNGAAMAIVHKCDELIAQDKADKGEIIPGTGLVPADIRFVRAKANKCYLEQYNFTSSTSRSARMTQSGYDYGSSLSVNPQVSGGHRALT